jgi:hypothetical protein
VLQIWLCWLNPVHLYRLYSTSFSPHQLKTNHPWA